MRIPRLLLATALVAAGLAAVAVTTTASQAIPPSRPVYLSLGDSLSVGYQPGLGDTTQGFSEDVYNALRLKPTNGELDLVKMGCSGETTTTFINGGECTDGRYSTGSQLGDAIQFIKSDYSDIKYISIDIGANDVDGCATGSSINAACIVQGEKTIAQNLNTILSAIKAADHNVAQKIGMAYYDPFLAEWLTGPTGQAIATASVTALAGINLTESAEYTAYGFKVADVFTKFKSAQFTPFVNTPPYGKLPINVSRICTWTYMCAVQNIHPNPTGYQQIADAFLAKLT